jgi:exopolysaccharide biosynthesis polyprenyl glycosylphosphotransferase
MLRQFSVRRVLIFAVIDWLGTLTMLFLAAWLRTRSVNVTHPFANLLLALRIPHSLNGSAPGWVDIVTPPVFALVAIIWPCCFIVFSVYDGRRNPTLQAELRNIITAISVATLVLAGTLYLTYRYTSREVVLMFSVLDFALLSVSRIILWGYRRRQPASPARCPAVVVVGAGPVGQKAIKQLQRYSQADLGLVGYVDDDPDKQGQNLGGLPVLGTLADLPDIIERYRVQNALVALPLHAHSQIVQVCRTLQNALVHVHVIPDLFALSFPGATLDGFEGIPVIDLGQPSIHGLRRYQKRAFDIVVATVVLLLIWPVLLVVAALIKLDSPGPCIYKQERVGENGRRFSIYKFRSMRSDADPRLHQAYVTRLITQNIGANGQNGEGVQTLKMDDDPRITRVGRVLRKTSLDEMPQLVNVIRGEMSLVGPRPPIPYEVDVYQDWHKRRLQAIPGVTGLWQVQGRNQVSFDEMVRLDLKYIEQQSLWLDFKILVQTPLSVVLGRGAG